MSTALEPIEIPDHALVHGQAFIDWFAYNAPWRVMPVLGLLACPLCAAAVLDDWVVRSQHGFWHLQLLRRLPEEESA